MLKLRYKSDLILAINRVFSFPSANRIHENLSLLFCS